MEGKEFEKFKKEDYYQSEWNNALKMNDEILDYYQRLLDTVEEVKIEKRSLKKFLKDNTKPKVTERENKAKIKNEKIKRQNQVFSAIRKERSKELINMEPKELIKLIEEELNVDIELRVKEKKE